MDFKFILNKITSFREKLLTASGKVADIGVKKMWLSELDIEIEDSLKSEIVKRFPKSEFYAEENNYDLKATDDLWIVDPISDTFGFLRGLPTFSVVISHMTNGEVDFGAVYNPSRDEFFYAQRGKGLMLNGQKIEEKHHNDLLFLFKPGHLSTTKDLSFKIYKHLSELGTVRIIGSEGLHYAYVAAGRADLAFTFNKDIYPAMAGKILVEEAGGSTLDLSNQSIHLKSSGIILFNNNVKNIADQIIQLASN